MADEEFDFRAELSLLDVGATTSMLRAGWVRPTVVAYTASAGLEAFALDWPDEAGFDHAVEEARKCLRSAQPRAYGVVAHLERVGKSLRWVLPGVRPQPSHEFLGLAMLASDGQTRGMLYPVRRGDEGAAFGMPTEAEGAGIDWLPFGDLWRNPFCVGDVVRFAPRERPVEPGTPLWDKLVDLTRLRIQQDQPNAQEYMTFLDDLRNGIMVVAGRPAEDPQAVLVRPRTTFNPVGTLRVAASRLVPFEDEGTERSNGS